MQKRSCSIDRGTWTLLIISSALLACAGTMPTYVGQTATQEEKVVLLDGGPHEGNWTTDDLTIDYTYVKKADTIDVNGRIELDSSLSTGYTAVEGFRVRINFLDAQKTVLGSELIFVVGHRAPIRSWGFEHRFDPPPALEAINFSYSGTAIDFSGSGPAGRRKGNGEGWDFWQNP